jgi:hypothetical protein
MSPRERFLIWLVAVVALLVIVFIALSGAASHAAASL